jgi:hypothetical protein
MVSARDLREKFCGDYSPTSPFFLSLAKDYPEFLDWYQKCIKKDRPCWVIEQEGLPEGMIIYKSESTQNTEEQKELQEMGVPGKDVLKICLFKIGENIKGERCGELLLKKAMDFAFRQKFDSTYLTVFPKHVQLIKLIEKFGFQKGKNKGNEEVYFKYTKVLPAPQTSPAFEFHKKFWPCLSATGVKKYIVPIVPEYHMRLFPEAEQAFSSQITFLDILSHSPGNAIRKVYVCNAVILSIEPGSVLFFYRSRSSTITSIGVLESYQTATNFNDLKMFVDTRSVYKDDELSSRVIDKKKAKVLNFYYARDIKAPISLAALKQYKILTAAPQSIMNLSEEAYQKLFHSCLTKEEKEIFYA